MRFNSARPSKGTLRFVSPVLKHVVFPALSRSGYLRYAAGAGPAVVTYHGVFPAGYEIKNSFLDGGLVRADSLRCQVQLLKRHYYVISPEEFLGWSSGELSLPPRSVLLTCDDALRNTLTEMVPILQDLGVSCLFFATGASAESVPSMLWYEELYLMLLEAGAPIALDIPAAGLSISSIALNEKHLRWWTLVEQLSQFDGKLRRRFLDQIRDQLILVENWSSLLCSKNRLWPPDFLPSIGPGLAELVAAGMTIGAHSLSHPILSRASRRVRVEGDIREWRRT